MIQKLIVAGIFLSASFACTTGSKNDTYIPDESPATKEYDSVSISFPWIQKYSLENTLINRIAVPDGFSRIPQDNSSFGFWLRRLPLKAGKPDVLLYNGSKKYNQNVHEAVLDIDPGKKDLQQCADAVIRLRAEFLFHQKTENKIAFHFTNGDLCKWSDWKTGIRPHIKGNSVTWKKTAQADNSYSSFKSYLQTVFMYAGSASLEKELVRKNKSEILPGDVWIKGGSPGHAVMVMDVATDVNGKRIFLLAQSYMPAQEIHLLKNPLSPALSPWYKVEDISTTMVTPEWTFNADQLRFFKE